MQMSKAQIFHWQMLDLDLTVFLRSRIYIFSCTISNYCITEHTAGTGIWGGQENKEEQEGTQ